MDNRQHIAGKEKDPDQWRDMVRNIQTILLSAITALILATFGFLWNINGKIIEMSVEGEYRYKVLEEATATLQEIKTELKNIEKRVSDLESKNRSENEPLIRSY